MFGYVKAFKPEMKMREFERYRSVYCALCKAIAADYGQIPRLAVSYDLTFLLLLVQALQNEEPLIQSENCVLHPFRKRPIGQTDSVLRLGAAVAVLLASSKLDDNVADGEKRLSTWGLRLLTRSAVRQAKRLYPALASSLAQELRKLADLEHGFRQESADSPISKSKGHPEDMTSLISLSKTFGRVLELLSDVFGQSAGLDETLRSKVSVLMQDLGAWVYLVDAADDFEEDRKRRAFSFIPALDKVEALSLVSPLLVSLEERMEKTAALLPYQRDAGIVANVLIDGLPLERQRLFGHSCTR